MDELNEEEMMEVEGGACIGRGSTTRSYHVTAGIPKELEIPYTFGWIEITKIERRNGEIFRFRGKSLGNPRTEINDNKTGERLVHIRYYIRNGKRYVKINASPLVKRVQLNTYNSRGISTAGAIIINVD